MPETVIAGRYELEQLLGRGGMSEVYRAQDRELGRQVALKLLAPDADTARFEREARAVAALAHPNVTQLYDYGEDDGRPYIVLEYVPGGTLEDRLTKAGGQPLPDEEARVIAAGMAAGLAHAHSRGVVHRDLKPANVLFDEEGRPKLADFGIARMAAGEGTLTEAGTVLGTAAYISPEQASGEPASAASDVYSFGVMLFRMLTGRLPFESSDPMELVLMNRDAPPPAITAFRSDPPARLEAAAVAALEKDPALRPQDGAALLAALGIVGAAALTTATTALATDATQVLPVAAGAGAAAAATDIGATSIATSSAAGAAPVAGGPPPRPPRSRAPLLIGLLVLLLLGGGALAYAVTRPSSTDTPTTGTLATISIPTTSTASTTASTESTTAPTSTTASTTAATTTAPATTRQTATQPTTTGRTTTAQTTAPPPTTTAPPATTTAPDTTTDIGTTTTLPLPLLGATTTP